MEGAVATLGPRPDAEPEKNGTGPESPARQLVNLKGIPTMILVSEASYHSVFDHCTAKWLNKAGVKTDFIRLEDRGVRGNGHMVMIEKNNLDIAKVVDEWIETNVK